MKKGHFHRGFSRATTSLKTDRQTVLDWDTNPHPPRLYFKPAPPLRLPRHNDLLGLHRLITGMENVPWGLSSRLTSQQPGGPPPPTSHSLPILFQPSSCLPLCTACRFPLRRGFQCLSGGAGGVAWRARQAGSPLARGAFRPTPLPFSSLQHVPLTWSGSQPADRMHFSCA